MVEENGKREKRETNSFPVTGFDCDSFVDRKKRKMMYVAMAPSKQRPAYARLLDWSSFESEALLENSSLPDRSRGLEAPFLVLGNRRRLT